MRALIGRLLLWFIAGIPAGEGKEPLRREIELCRRELVGIQRAVRAAAPARRLS